MDEERRAARWRKRRLIYNNDGDDVREVQNHHDGDWQLLARSGGELIDDYLNARTTSLVGTNVDSIWYSTCTGGLWFTHHTKLGGYYGKGVSQELIDTYGRDDLQIQVDYAHDNGLEVFWSLRVNDTHDSYPEGYRTRYYGIAPFKLDHPEYLLGEQGDWEKYPEGPRHSEWTSLDFSRPEVTEHIFSLVREVCEGYDVDGVELDFLRSPPFFAASLAGNPVEERHLEMMTDLVRRIKRMTAEVELERGRPLLLAVRTPFTASDARFVGLDVERWLAEDLIDILIAGGLKESMMTDSFRKIVDLAHQYDVPVYPCVVWPLWVHWAFLGLGSGEHRTYGSWVETLYAGHPNDLDKRCYIQEFNSWDGVAPAWRGAAMNAWNSGADGVYIFNGFHSTDIDTWREIGDPALLANKSKMFGVDRFPGESSLEESQELQLNPGEPVSVPFQVGEDAAEGDKPAWRFRLHLWDFTGDDEILVKLNDVVLDGLSPAGPSQTATGGQWLECPLNPARVKRGENIVEFTVTKVSESRPAPVIVDGVQLHVDYDS